MCTNKTAHATKSVVRQLGKRICTPDRVFALKAACIAARSFIKWAIMIR